MMEDANKLTEIITKDSPTNSSDEDHQQLKNAKLFEAIRKKQSEKIIIGELKRCLDDGAAINTPNKKGKTVLDIAFQKKYKYVVEFLLKQKGINNSTPDPVGKTASSLVKVSDNYDIINISTKYSVDQHSVGVFDSHQQGPSQLISAGTDEQVARLSADLLSIQQSPTKRKATTNNDEEGIAKKNRPINGQDQFQLDSTIDVNTAKSTIKKLPHNDNDNNISDKKHFFDKLEIPSGGSKLAQHGNIFQLKLLMLFLWRAKENDYTAFRLATELSEAEKFDDIAFQYQKSNGDKWKFRLLQAKHKEGGTAETKLSKIKKSDLLSTDDNEAFSLQKYFRSYLKIKKRSEESSVYSVFSDSEIEDIIVITNTDFDSSELKNDFDVDREQDIGADELLKVDKIQNTKWQKVLVYKLKNQENNAIVRQLKPIFEDTSDFYKLVDELTEHILTEKQIDKFGLFKDYYYPLISEVFKKEEGKSGYNIKFLSKFISGDGLSKETAEFHNALIKEIIIQNTQVVMKISEEFGKNQLPSDYSQLKELAKKLADFIETKKELTVSDFEGYHIVLASEVININTKKFRSNFIIPPRNRINKTNLRDFLKKEIAKIRQIEKITNDQLKSIEFIVSQDFGKLPNNDSKLENLAETLANCIKKTEELKPSLSEEFQNYHVVLAREVIDIQKNKFHKIFIHGKEKEGNNFHKLSTSFRKFRRILFDKMVTDDQVQSTKNILRTKNIKISEGFKKSFTPETDPQIPDVQEFAQQINELLSKNIYEKIVEIDENSVTKEKFNTFEANINRLAGYVLIEKFNKVHFSTFFLHSDELPGNLKNFREELRELLGQEKFESIYEYKFFIKIKGFRTCEEGALSITLPILYEVADVTEFFDKLKFVVNYPDRTELNELLEGEIQNNLKKLDSKAFNSLYQEDLHNWMADRVGTFYTVDKAKILFQQIKENLSLWTIDGFNKPYFADACKEYKFKKCSALNDFLSNDIQQILHLVFEDLALGRTRIVQTFEQLQKRDSTIQYTRGFGYIFLYLKQLDYPDLRSIVYEVLKDKSKFNLIVIECDTQHEIPGLDYTLSEVISQYSSNTNSRKKIILITKENDALANKLKTVPLSVYSTFSDLETDSQKKCLKEKVFTFQGSVKKTSLKKLIEIKDLDKYLSQKENVNRLNNMINSETLVNLIKNEEVKIGRSLEDLGEINDYYITRRINQQIVLNKNKIQRDIEERKMKSDFFVISGVDSELLKGDNDRIIVFDKNNDESVGGKFRELCEQNTGSNIHWLKSESGKIMWYRSEGSISNLVKYRQIDKFDRTDYKTCRNVLIEQEFLKNNTSKIVIIADTAGMGKSTVLTSFSVKMKEDNPSLWVIRIDLNDFVTVFQQELTKRKSNRPSSRNQDINTVVNFLLNDLLSSQEQLKFKSELEKEVFRSNFNGQGKIALLFDGFDEISPDYQEVVIDILQKLKNSKVEKLFVTTRLNMRGLLENRLEVFSHLLEPFSEDDQIEFLTKYWTKKLELKDLNREQKGRLNKYVESLIKKFSTSINDMTFIGIPLQTMMLAEVFQEKKGRALENWGEWDGCNEFLNSQAASPKLPEKFDLLGLYEHFVKKKFYDIYLKGKKGRDFFKIGEKELADENYVNFKERHEILAVHRLFTGEDVEKLLSEGEIRNLHIWLEGIKSAKKNEGIIDQIIDHEVQFVHRTFAEYFASFFLVKRMSSNAEIICTAVDRLADNTSPVFIRSLAEILNLEKVRIKDKTVLEFITFHTALNFAPQKTELDSTKLFIRHGYNAEQAIMGIPKKNYLKFFNALLEINYQDDQGKTSLLYAVQCDYYCEKTIKYVLDFKHDILEKNILKHGTFKKPEYEHSNLVKFVNLKDGEGNSALYYAIRKDNIDLAFELLFKGASIDSLTVTDIDWLIRGMLYTRNEGQRYNNSILQVYADQENEYRPIQEKLFLRAPGIFEKLDQKDQSRILSYFFVHGRVKVIKALVGTINDLEQRIKVLNNEDNGFTPLDRVNHSNQLSDDGRLSVTKYLVENNGKKANHNVGWSYLVPDKYITKILQAAAQRGHIKTFEHFIDQENHDFYYLYFIEAAEKQQFNIVEYLLDKHRDNIEKDGNTILHSACDIGANLKIIKFLIDNGEDINAKNDKNETPLFMAIYAKTFNTIKYLISRGANINAEDETYNTPLSCAVENDQVDIIKYLLRNGANISENASQLIRDKVEFFRNPSRFNLDLVDKNGFPRLHAAIKSSNIKWVEFIVRQGADINKTDRQGKTPLHWASNLQNTDIVELLLQYGAIFDGKDINKSTPLDLLPESPNRCKINFLMDVLNKLFSSKNLMQDLNEQLLERQSDSLKDWGPYGKGYPDVWDGNNPMLFILNARNGERKTLLHIAADTNDVLATEILLKFNHNYLIRRAESHIFSRYKNYQSISIDAIDSQRNTPLHIAAQEGHYGMVSLLLEEGAIFDAENLRSETPEVLAKNNNHDTIVEYLKSTEDFFIAIKEGNVLGVENCINKRAYKNARNKSGKTPLHFAASSDQSAVIQYLLHVEANLEAIDLNKNTPLHVGAKHDQTETVKLLLKYGARFNAKNIKDQRPSDLAPIHGQSYNLLKQIDELFDVIQSDNPKVSMNDLEMIHKKCEMDMSTIINTRDNEDNTLLHYSAKLNDFDMVKLFLENGAIFNAKNKLENTPEDLTNNQDIRNLLVSINKLFENVDNIREETVDIQILTNVRSTYGGTLLMKAADYGKLDIVKWLVGHGANPDSIDNHGKNVLHYAADSGQVDVFTWLEEERERLISHSREEQKIDVADENSHSMDSSCSDSDSSDS